MTNIDLKKGAYRDQYAAATDPSAVEIPTRKYLMIDGSGDPNTSIEYRDAVEALYPIAYSIRAAIKEATGDAYVVLPLEGLWWAKDMNEFGTADKSNWLWTTMVGVPDWVTDRMATEIPPAVTPRNV